MQKPIWDDQLFVLDSDTLEQAETHLYGYCLSRDRMVENHTLAMAPDFAPTGLGCYVYLERKGSRLAVRQDFMGSYGLYLYRKDGYFALSNSFLYLVEYLKPRRPMTFSQGYADCFLAADLCSIAYGETMVREIEALDRAASVEIDIAARTLSIGKTDYAENSVALDSPEGMALLDGWFERWTAILRSIRAETPNLVTDLSGGFDSRLSFLLLANSGAPLDDIAVYSMKGKVHTYAEDYAIASEIADRYHFQLNDMSRLDTDSRAIAMEDCASASFYIKLCFHKSMDFPTRYNARRKYRLTGNGGECVRTYWRTLPWQYRGLIDNRAGEFPWKISQRMTESAHEMLEKNFILVREKYHIDDPSSMDIMPNHYREVRAVLHFGKAAAEAYMSNTIHLSPLLDPELHRLQLTSGPCQDHDLLMALMFVRYAPDMLDFRFDGNRSISEKTIQYAREISARHPRTETAPGAVTGVFGGPERPADIREADHQLSWDDTVAYMKRVFFSAGFRQALDQQYGAAVGKYLAHDVQTRVFGALTMGYTAMGIVKVAQDTQDQALPPMSPGAYFASFLDAPGAETPPDAQPQPDRPALAPTRIDVMKAALQGTHIVNDICWVDLDDPWARLKPVRIRNLDFGYLVESGAGELEFVFRCRHAGRVRIVLRSPAADKLKGKLAVYSHLTVNGQEKLREPVTVSPEISRDCCFFAAKNQDIRVRVTWEEQDAGSARPPRGRGCRFLLEKAYRRLKALIRR